MFDVFILICVVIFGYCVFKLSDVLDYLDDLDEMLEEKKEK